MGYFVGLIGLTAPLVAVAAYARATDPRRQERLEARRREAEAAAAAAAAPPETAEAEPAADNFDAWSQTFSRPAAGADTLPFERRDPPAKAG
ncbi:hypothetical protein [Phenylobacterium sp.]|uniref:hypothetical protein n=1 Tax=Phenylobacterium sp. TaxID=1871053 RepID=UPI00391C2F9A